MNTIIEQYENEKYRLTVTQAECEENTLHYQDLLTFVCKHPRYKLGNRDIGNQDLTEYIAEDLDISIYTPEPNSHYEMAKTKEQLIQDIKENAFITPLYLYDHSGLSVYTVPSTSDYTRLDQSFIGFAYVSKEYASSYYETEDLNKLEEIIETHLNDLLKEYTHYLNGDVYEYKLETKEYCPHCDQAIYKEVDTYSYYYTLEHTSNGIVDTLTQTIQHDQVTNLLVSKSI